MGAHHAQADPSAAVATRIAATAAAAVALTGVGAGIASAHDGDGPGGYDDGPGATDAVSSSFAGHHDGRTVADDRAALCDPSDDGSPVSVAGLDVPGLDELCSGPSTGDYSSPAVGGDQQMLPSSPSSWSGQGATGDRSATRAGGTSAAPSSAMVTPVSSNPIDTPPPVGTSRIIKLPTTR